MHTNSPYKRFVPLAGFLEAGESIEEAVHREVFEEVGLRVHNLQYFGSQSWPFPHSLMIAFTADYLDGEIRIERRIHRKRLAPPAASLGEDPTVPACTKRRRASPRPGNTGLPATTRTRSRS
jgi:NAD+ diphosphatase